MVKALIQGILGKKEAPAATAASGDEPPDELPPLAEDAVAKEIAAPKAAQQAPASAQPSPSPSPTASSEPPADLPSLDFEKRLSSLDFSTDDEKKSAQASAQAASQPSSAPSDLPAEIQRAKVAKMTAPDTSSPPSAPASSLPPRIFIDPKQVGFFSSVLDHVQKGDGAKEKLLEGDLFSRMNNYWELKKHEIKTGAMLSTREQLERDLIGCLDQLRVLEQKWQVQKMALEEDIKFLEQRERDIQLKSFELRRISNELLLFRSVKPEQYFRLRNGVVLKNLHDLVDILEVIDDATFNHHVSNGRNDFGDWVANVFMDPRLSSKIAGAKTKHEMIEALLTTPVMQQRLKKNTKMMPSHYFYLSNGVVLKSLSDLSDALKEMSDDLLSQHITYEKNDFANWARHSLKEEALASALEKAKSRKDLIAAVDVYL